MNYQEKVLCHRYHPPIKINNGIRTFIISTVYPRQFLVISVPPKLVVISDTLLMKLERIIYYKILSNFPAKIWQQDLTNSWHID